MRFSLVSLFFVTAAIGLYCGLFFALPSVLSLFALIFGTALIMPSAIVAGVVYGRGSVRAFFIGCIASCGWTCVGACYFVTIILVSGADFIGMITEETDADYGNITRFKWTFAILHGTTVLSGLIAIGIRWLCFRGATSANTVVATQHSAPTVLIDPRDKAELYAILQGRLTSGVAMSIGDGANSVNSQSETSTLNCTTTLSDRSVAGRTVGCRSAW